MTEHPNNGECLPPANHAGHPASHDMFPPEHVTRGSQDAGFSISRRNLLKGGVRSAGLLGIAASTGFLVGRESKSDTRWQINPDLCIQCGRCATECVLEISAVKCTHSFSMCGYCKLCTGYFDPEPVNLDEGAENQLCPTGALKREFIEDPYYEYSIIKDLCVGCGKCVKGCNMFGNGSLYLQVSHDRCVNCNMCAISTACPAQAFVRVPIANPYLLRGKGQAGT